VEVFLTEIFTPYTTEYIVDRKEISTDLQKETRDLLKRGVFDPRYISFLQQGYDQNIRDPNWFREVFGSYLDLVHRSEPATFEDDRKSYADYCNFPAELSRIREAKKNKRRNNADSFETVGQVLHVADTNLQTLVNELLLGASTRYGYKLVLHPQTNEKKVVFYDSMTNAGENWEAAWSREDVRISFLRSVDHTAPHLQLREWVNLYVFNSLCDKWENYIYDDSKRSEQHFWVSPPPINEGFGYGTITLGYVYSPFKSGQNEITIPARTIISEYSTAYFRQLALDIASKDDLERTRIEILPNNPSDIDLLSLPFSIQDEYVDYDLHSFVENIENLLESYSDLHKIYPEHRSRQMKHDQSRIVEDSRIDAFQHRLRWKRLHFKVALYLERNPEKLRRFVADDYQVAAEKLYKEFRKVDWENKLRNSGVEITSEMRKEKNREVLQNIKQRQENGSCPTALRKTKTVRVKNAQGEDIEMEVEDEDDEIKDCLIECRGKIVDLFQKVVKNCCWSAKAEKDVVYHSCPECGWYPGKPDILVDESVFVETKKIDKSEDSQAKTYLELVTPEADGEFDDVMERTRMPNVDSEFIDIGKSEKVYMVGFIPLRRKVKVEFVVAD
jgi:hypothetical protein